MSTRNSLFFSFLDRYASLAISVVSSMVIARLLTPAEIGVHHYFVVLAQSRWQQCLYASVRIKSRAKVEYLKIPFYRWSNYPR